MRSQARLATAPTDTTSGQIGNDIWKLADLLLLHSRVDEARVLLERAVEDRADSTLLREYIGRLGVIAGMQGDRQRALEIGRDLAAQPWRRSDQALWQARIAASLGEIDRATAILREAVGEGMTIMSIHFHSELLSFVLRDHPPFQALIKPKG